MTNYNYNIYGDLTNPASQHTNITPGLFPTHVDKKLLLETYLSTPITMLSGKEDTRPIVMRSLIEGGGLQWHIGRLRQLDEKQGIPAFDLKSGNEQYQTVDEVVMNAEYETFPVKLRYGQVLQYGVPFHNDLKANVRRQLIDLLSRDLTGRIFNAFSFGTYPNIKTANCNIDGTIPSFDRAITALPTERPTWNGNNTFPVYLNGYSTSANTSSATTGMSAKLIRQGGMNCNAGGTKYLIEPPIAPSTTTTYLGWPSRKRIMLMNPKCKPSLVGDPEFKDNATARGYSVGKTQPQLIDSGLCLGEYENTLIIECPELQDLEITSADGNKTIAWNVILGAGALFFGFARPPLFGSDVNELEDWARFWVKVWRGALMPRWPSKYTQTPGAVAGSTSLIEQGVMHVFCSV